jgi:hypothetical protein
MPANSSVKFTIALNDPNLDSDELEAQAQSLLAQMRDLDEIETVDRVLDPNPPAGNKAMGGILVGLLTAQVSKENALKLLGFLGDRLGNKPIELEVEDNGKKLKVKASSQTELTAAIEAAQKFLAT